MTDAPVENFGARRRVERPFRAPLHERNWERQLSLLIRRNARLRFFGDGDVSLSHGPSTNSRLAVDPARARRKMTVFVDGPNSCSIAPRRIYLPPRSAAPPAAESQRLDRGSRRRAQSDGRRQQQGSDDGNGSASVSHHDCGPLIAALPPPPPRERPPPPRLPPPKPPPTATEPSAAAAGIRSSTIRG